MEEVCVDRMETIREYAIPPWEPRLKIRCEPDREKAAEVVSNATGIAIATGASVKKGMVGIGSYIRDTLFHRTDEAVTKQAVTIGTREEQNPYTAELAAIAMALKNMLPSTHHRQITIITRNQSALRAISQPQQQSGQALIQQIYESTKLLSQRGNSVRD